MFFVEEAFASLAFGEFLVLPLGALPGYLRSVAEDSLLFS